MARKKNIEEKKPPLWILIMIFLSMITGIFTSVIGICKIENYFHPYWFGLIFGGIGLLFGLVVSNKVKPYIAINQRIKSEFGMTIMYISSGFIGVFLMSGALLNQSFSSIEKCDKFYVINKYRQESRFRMPEINSLVVNINGESYRIICSRDYWYRASIGQNIDLCLHNSVLGFDFVSVKNDKK